MEKWPYLQLKEYRPEIQDTLRYAYQLGDGGFFQNHNAQVFCHDESVDGTHKEDCGKPGRYPGHIITIVNYADGNDAFVVCKSTC